MNRDCENCLNSLIWTAKGRKINQASKSRRKQRIKFNGCGKENGKKCWNGALRQMTKKRESDKKWHYGVEKPQKHEEGHKE